MRNLRVCSLDDDMLDAAAITPLQPLIQHSAKQLHSNRFYDDEAARYAQRTLTAPLPPLLDAFIQSIEPGSKVLDLGCGAGRDLLTLCRAGFDCIGVDLSAGLADIARALTGGTVIASDMRTLNFGEAQFDGVVAIASLLHLSGVEQLRQLAKIIKWLRAGGFLLATMKIGSGSEVTRDDRRFTYIEPDTWLEMLQDCGFEVVQSQVTRSSNAVSTSDHDWLAVLARKPD